MQLACDEPIRVGPLTLRSRVFVPAHQPGLAVDGVPGDRYIAYQVARARAGVAMQVTGATPISPSSLWSANCLQNVDDRIIPGYARLANAVRGEGGRMLAQLAHPGPTETGGPDVIGPSPLFSQMGRQNVRQATHAELDRVLQDYVAAARRCRAGELDGIELTLAHGLLLAAFLSPLTNQRCDEYGGSFEARLAFPLKVIKEVREACGPDMILGVRLGAQDLVEGGLEPEDGARIARALQDQVDYINVIVGNNNWLEARMLHWPPTPSPHGLFRDVARTVKTQVSVPVCVVGRVTTVDLAEEILTAGDADMVGMVRAHIADPNLLRNARRGQDRLTRPCVGVNVCVTGGSAIPKGPVRCMFNPAAAIDEPTRAGGPGRGRAVVVGGGPAGMEAAYRLARAGHEVTLFERADRLGGTVASWAMAPSRREVQLMLTWWREQLDANTVDVRLSTPADHTAIAALDPRVIVLATGATSASMRIPGVPADAVISAVQALDHPAGGLGRVVVYDEIGGLDAALVAEKIARDAPRSVTLVTARVHVCEGEGSSTLFPMIRALNEAGVTVIERAVAGGAHDGLLTLAGLFGEHHQPVPFDTVIPVGPTTPVPRPRLPEGELARRCVVIGDARRPRRVTDAVADAFDAAQRAGRLILDQS